MWCCVVLRCINIDNQYLDKLYCPSPTWHKADIGIIPRIRPTIIVRENSEVIILYPDYMYIIYTYISCNVIYIYIRISWWCWLDIYSVYIYILVMFSSHPPSHFPHFRCGSACRERRPDERSRIIYRSGYRIPFSYCIVDIMSVSRKNVTTLW